MKPTAIQWTDLSTNPIVFHDSTGKKHWHCEKVSAGCTNCNAESLEKRFGGPGAGYIAKNTPDRTPSLDEAELRRILRYKVKGPYRNGATPMVFPFDMTDCFAPWVTDAMLDRLFAVFALRPDIIFQVLTKRPERMREYLTNPSRALRVSMAIVDHYSLAIYGNDKLYSPRRELAASLGVSPVNMWPLPNVWLGTSVENQEAAETRIPHLLATPAAVRFLSCEPLLGPVDLTELPRRTGALFPLIGEVGKYAGPDGDLEFSRDIRVMPRQHMTIAEYDAIPPSKIDWVIVGGESGSGARPMDLAWARDIVRQCQSAGVAVFVKQLGAKPYTTDISAPSFPWGTKKEFFYDGTGAIGNIKYKLKDRHGGDMDEWPADLRIRSFPGRTGGAEARSEFQVPSSGGAS